MPKIQVQPIGSLPLGTRTHFTLDDTPTLDLVLWSDAQTDPFTLRTLVSDALSLRNSVIRNRNIQSLLSDEHPCILCADPANEFTFDIKLIFVDPVTKIANSPLKAHEKWKQ